MGRRGRGGSRKPPEDDYEQNPVEDPNVFMAQEDDFEEGDDPVADRVADAERDPRIEHVSRNPGPVDPNSYTTPLQQPDGSWTRPNADNVGRPTVVPLWEHAHIYPAVTQLRVWRNVNGNLHEVGPITAKAGMDQFIETFWPSMPKEGEQAALFEARGMDAQGNFVGQVFPIGPIDANHITLRQMRAAKAQAMAGAYVPPPTAPGLDLALLDAIKKMFVDPALEAARAAREEARLAQIAREEEAKRVADERVKLAENTAGSVETMANKLMETAADADKRRADQQTQHFATMTQLEQRDRDRERQRVEDERRARDEERRREREEAEEKRKAEREEAEEKRKADRAEAEEKRRVEREEREEARKEREREYQRIRAEEREREDARRKEEQARMDERKREDEKRWDRERDEARRRDEEREGARKREHDLLLAQLEQRARQDREHAERMAALTHKDSPEGAIGSLNKALAPLGIDIKELAVPFIQRMMSPESEFDVAGLVEGVGKIAVDGLGKVVDYAKTMKAIEAQKNAQGGHPVMGTQQIVQQQPAPQQPGATTAAAPPAGTPTVEPAHNASSLPLDMQRACRAALRQAINELRQTPEDKWADVLQKAYNTEPGLYHWFKQLTIRGALKDIQVEAAFIDHILNHPALNNPLLAEVPRG